MTTAPMAALALLLSLASFLTGVSAQTASEYVWSSVAYVHHGDRLPLHHSFAYGSGLPALTPLGAHQMLAQGEMFRARYLSRTDPVSPSLRMMNDKAIIRGLEPYALDNQQITVLANTDAYMAPSALAFLQGFYPPRNNTQASGTGGVDAARLADGSLVDYPFGGYQYPRVQTLSSLDPMSTWVQGHVDCLNYRVSTEEFLAGPTARELNESSSAFYQSLHQKFFSAAGFRAQDTNFMNAYRLYDYARFGYTHDNATRAVLLPSEVSQLSRLADTRERNTNGNLTASGNTKGDRIRAIAGRMLAGRVLSLLRENISNRGQVGKLNLIFGTHHPLVAFFALSGLTTMKSRQTFETLPRHGAAMVFELLTINGAGNPVPTYPRTSDLMVRFMYTPSTDSTELLTQYGLFGHGNQEMTMRWDDFVRNMETISIASIAEWCNMCDSGMFCSGVTGSSSGGGSSPSRGSSSPLSPVVAGALGAVVTIGALAVAALVAVLLGGVRFSRRHRPGDQPENGGGFKGAEKKESDPDVAVARGGVRHERTGSWELRGGGNGASNSTGGTTESEAAASGPGTRVVSGASVSPASTVAKLREPADSVEDEFYATPVKPREGF